MLPVRYGRSFCEELRIRPIAGEIGARSKLSEVDPAEGRAAWDAEIGAVLASLRRVTKERGLAVLLIADSVVGGAALHADDVLVDLAPRQGFDVVAIASQARPHFHGGTRSAFTRRSRAEHAVLLQPSPAPRQNLREAIKHEHDAPGWRGDSRQKTSRRLPR